MSTTASRPMVLDLDGLRDRCAEAKRRNTQLVGLARTACTRQAALLDEVREGRRRAQDQLRQLRAQRPLLRQIGDGRTDLAGPGKERSRPRPPARLADPWPDGLGAMHRDYAATRDPKLEDRLFNVYESFAVGLTRRVGRGRELPDDLAQVARLGLIHALRRFDPDLGRPFVAFARVTIEGELKRHIRDRSWTMRVPRSIQERYLGVMKASDDLRDELGRSPTIRELAGYLGLSEEQVLEAQELARDRRPLSLDAPSPSDPAGPRPLALDPGVEDGAFAHIENQQLLDQLLRRLTERDREIVYLRFTEELSQTEIAARLGVSQMYVSRQLSRILGRLRAWAR
jgi:RNA polymerase sigma-B factor